MECDDCEVESSTLRDGDDDNNKIIAFPPYRV